MNRFFCFALLTIFSLKMFSQPDFTITHIYESKEKSAENLYVYGLPRTSVTLKIVSQRVTILAGPYHDYAKEYLGITNAPQENKTKWKIDSIDIQEYNDVDPENYYIIKSKNAFNPEILFKLGKQGLVFDNENTCSTISEILQKQKNSASQSVSFTELSMTNYYKEAADTFYKILMKDSAFVKVPIIRSKIESTNTRDKAKEAADVIMKIRQSRYDDIAPDEGSLPEANAAKYAISELNKLENKYLSLFLGVQQSDRFVTYITYTPQTTITNDSIVKLLYFSENEGLANNISSNSTPISLTFNKQKSTNALAKWYSTLEKPEKNHLFYRVPEKATVYVNINNKTVASKQILVSQFGAILSIPVGK